MKTEMDVQKFAEKLVRAGREGVAWEPVLTIVAGSDGCGKSTLTSSLREEFQQAPILDPDAIAKSIRDTMTEVGSDLEAGKRVLRLAEELIQKRSPKKISGDAGDMKSCSPNADMLCCRS